MKQRKLSRRTFLKGMGALTAAGAASIAAGCELGTTRLEDTSRAAVATSVATTIQYPEVPYTPTHPPPDGLLQVLSMHEARTVEALTARILPGTPDDPGAREAGVVYYIDNFLAYHEGFPEPTYRSAPYAQSFDPANPPAEAVQWYKQLGLPMPPAPGGQGSQQGQSGGQGSQQGQGGQGSQQGQGGGGQQQGGNSHPTPTPPLPQDNIPTPTPPGAAYPGALLAVTATVPASEQAPGQRPVPIPQQPGGQSNGSTGTQGGQGSDASGGQSAPGQGAQPALAATVPASEQAPGAAPAPTAGQPGGQSNGAAGSQGANGGQPVPYQTIWIPSTDVERYGYQSILSPRDVYRIGVAAVDRYANSTFGKDFVDLTEAQQDQIVGDMADGKATGFDRNLSATAFFHNLRRHTSEGMFSDPVYGGNRGMVGWKLVGYPGAQRGYDASEYQREGTKRPPQSIMQMHPFNPGQPVNGQVILPVSGSNGPTFQQPPAPGNDVLDNPPMYQEPLAPTEKPNK